MYRFKSIKYLSTTGMITALLVVVGYCSSLFFGWAISALAGGSTTLQLFDALFIPFCAIFKGPMMLFAGAIAGLLFDLIVGVSAATIPATVLIRILMFLVIKLLISDKQKWSFVYSFFLAAIILMIGYPLYYLVVYQDQAKVLQELYTDLIQASFAYFVALILYYYLFKIQIKSNNRFWDDTQFDYLKAKKIKEQDQLTQKDEELQHGN